MSADLNAACEKVGRYLYEFALLEREINASIVQILDLKSDAADVVSHSLDFFKKVNLLKIVANETAPKEDVDELQDLFNDIAKLNEGRILMAHGAFEPAPNDAVQFRVFSDPNANDADVGTGEAKRLGRIDYRKECRIIRHETAVSHFNALAVTGEDKLLLEEWIG